MKISLFKKLARDQRGLSTMEYAVLFVIIVVGALTFWSKLGGKLTENLNTGTDAFDKTLGGVNKSAQGSGQGQPQP
jgi:Flp pilus assembly pilin Flp